MRARLASDAADLRRVRHLRDLAFPGAAGQADPFDAQALHLMVEGPEDALLGCLRLRLFAGGADLAESYAAGFYDLAPLAATGLPALEPGRVCLSPEAGLLAPAALRLIWAALTLLGEEAGVGLLFGCASFPGAEWQAHRAGLALLATRHLGPPGLRPGPRVTDPLPYPALVGAGSAAEAGLPPLLRFYLGMGGWVSDHAVIDRQLDTLHVFTCVEVAKIPPARQKALRALAGTADLRGLRGADPG